MQFFGRTEEHFIIIIARLGIILSREMSELI